MVGRDSRGATHRRTPVSGSRSQPIVMGPYGNGVRNGRYAAVRDGSGWAMVVVDGPDIGWAGVALDVLAARRVFLNPSVAHSPRHPKSPETVVTWAIQSCSG